MVYVAHVKDCVTSYVDFYADVNRNFCYVHCRQEDSIDTNSLDDSIVIGGLMVSVLTILPRIRGFNPGRG
jgi:hypothetical protein